jgi:hypothetical protein
MGVLRSLFISSRRNKEHWENEYEVYEPYG